MDGGKRNQSSKLAILVFHSLLALLVSTTPVHALNIGVQSANSDITTSKQQQCSRTCESQHCNDDYLNVKCNEALLNCIARVRESGKGTFKGNKCMVEEVVDVITLVIEAALLAGRVLHRP